MSGASFHQIGILGVGLLGGSIGLAHKARSLGGCVVGYGHRAETLQRAMQIGAIDGMASSPADAARDSDLVILCTPVSKFEEMLLAVRDHLKAGAIVTDVGSTKGSVAALAAKILPGHSHFVGSHPMAGSEKRGVEFARADLFQGRRCIVTPVEKSDAAAVESVANYWRSLGMIISHHSPADHDRLVALVSHLPHAVAASIVACQSDASIDLAGPGFIDATRIASGDPGLWRDIFLDNRENLLAAAGQMQAELQKLLDLIASGEGADIERWLLEVGRRRAELVRRKLGELEQ